RGNITIAPSGDVLPCPSVRDVLLGNVKRQSLRDVVLSDDLIRLWVCCPTTGATCGLRDFS
ncbi:SPASM domain-containing protein, partial [Dehalococcoidia bacterium]|nr:SPASM domain-containing protein [Dehalococcoidia bacterium]